MIFFWKGDKFASYVKRAIAHKLKPVGYTPRALVEEKVFLGRFVVGFKSTHLEIFSPGFIISPYNDRLWSCSADKTISPS